jgi:hypothetical protein
MSTVQRSVFLNPIEPAPLSLRAAMGMETWLELNYFSQNGAVYANDVAAQLQLTGRTGGATTTYAVPSIDVVNGRARAVIPAGDITDPNGYRLRLVGTVNQQPALIATGVLMPIAAAGIEALPQDVIDSIDLTLAYNVDATVIVTIWHDEGKANPYDLTAATIGADVLSAQGGSVLASFAVVESENQATLTMPAATVNTLPAACWWRLSASGSGGSQVLAEGNVTITGTPGP